MDPLFMLALLGAIGGPLSGILTGWFLYRSSKRNTDATTGVSKTEADTHRFEAITSGWAEYTETVDKDRARLEARVKTLEESLTVLTRDFALLLKHVDAVEKLAPLEQLPVRPSFEWRNSA